MKERRAASDFPALNCQVTVTGIPVTVCVACESHEVSDETSDEIEMFLRPVLEGGAGMHLLGSSHHLTIDLADGMVPGPLMLSSSTSVSRTNEPSLAAALSSVIEVAEEAA